MIGIEIIPARASCEPNISSSALPVEAEPASTTVKSGFAFCTCSVPAVISSMYAVASSYEPFGLNWISAAWPSSEIWPSLPAASGERSFVTCGKPSSFVIAWLTTARNAGSVGGLRLRLDEHVLDLLVELEAGVADDVVGLAGLADVDVVLVDRLHADHAADRRTRRRRTRASRRSRSSGGSRSSDPSGPRCSCCASGVTWCSPSRVRGPRRLARERLGTVRRSGVFVVRETARRASLRSRPERVARPRASSSCLADPRAYGDDPPSTADGALGDARRRLRRALSPAGTRARRARDGGRPCWRAGRAS